MQSLVFAKPCPCLSSQACCIGLADTVFAEYLVTMSSSAGLRARNRAAAAAAATADALYAALAGDDRSPSPLSDLEEEEPSAEGSHVSPYWISRTV
jgi:hypothetical protein